MQEFNSVAKGNVSDTDLSRAKSVTHTHTHPCYLNLFTVHEPSLVHHNLHKHNTCLYRNQLKASYLMGVEQASSLSDNIATQVSQPLLISTPSHTHTYARMHRWHTKESTPH